jgi:hypothetical protein
MNPHKYLEVLEDIGNGDRCEMHCLVILPAVNTQLSRPRNGGPPPTQYGKPTTAPSSMTMRYVVCLFIDILDGMKIVREFSVILMRLDTDVSITRNISVLLSLLLQIFKILMCLLTVGRLI